MSHIPPLAPTPSDLEVPADAPAVFQRDVIVVGASAGGVQALQGLVAQLPPEFPASVLVVLHMNSSGTSVLHSILDRAGPLPATDAQDGEPLERAHIYVAPPDSHLLLRGPEIHLSAGPRENGHRPAIDPLFRSAARAYGPRVIGLILSGMLDDGTDGLRLVKARGGACIVQDPGDAAYTGMPESAIEYAGPDLILPLTEIGEALCALVDAPLAPGLSHGVADPARQEIDLLEADLGREHLAGSPTGHAYLPESLNEHQGEALESALWNATRTLDERSDLLRRMARRHADLREAAASIGPVARLVVDSQRFLVDANDRATELFSIGPADLGRPLQDLEVSYRPLELRSPLDRAFEGGRPVVAGRVEWGELPDERILEVEVTPVVGLGQTPMGAAITFADVTEFARLAIEHGDSKRELEAAYEELQSTVEELETTNEELQSANDELEAMNDEQRRHTEELDRLNLFLEGILGNLGVGVAMVDRESKIQLWNANSQDLWGLRPDEVEGVDLLALDIGLPVAELREALEDATSAAAKSTDLTLDAVNRRGRAFQCEVRVMPLFSASEGLFGGIVLMREVGEGRRFM